MRKRILIFSPTYISAICNLLFFIKKISKQVDLFITSLSDNGKADLYKELFISNNMFFVPNVYFPPFSDNDCIPRIDYYTTYQDQEIIYKRYFPDLYVNSFKNCLLVMDKINPDIVITCAGSLFIYNVLLACHLSKICSKLYFYQDLPYAHMYDYVAVRHNFELYKHYIVCNETIRQKQFLISKYEPHLLDMYSDLYCSSEKIYGGL